LLASSLVLACEHASILITCLLFSFLLLFYSSTLPLLNTHTGLLSLYKNKLIGTIPSTLKLRNLQYLDLSYNLMSGTIPSDWVTDMARLRVLYLDHNMFTGSLPIDFPKVGNKRLEIMHLNDNQFSGYVPGDYEVVTFLESVQLQNNQFTGIGQGICDMIVFTVGPGELTNFRTDCSICNCDYLCGPDRCYA
jgi:Leucine rich repeat